MIDMSVVMSGSTPVRLIVPVTARLIVSELLKPPLPAEHSPGTTPDAVLLFAAVIASRKVHKPSLPFATSAVLLTVIVLAALTFCRFDHNDTDTISARQIEIRISARVRARSLGDDGMGCSF
jgi:hypothetical protein